ncbi:transmembrane emp24 domain-containing protein 10 precursor [Panicum miliaceum]|uniref:Transmembrane emp24 domain-containing protein 10 n=1 Tax=Panicum miliaceum TaxID=4540 RepID=A0A3L6T291_PANMI|nr:transmembrane emp24 domain-containing protein 10 precursor [Panicum miliaceum]
MAPRRSGSPASRWLCPSALLLLVAFALLPAARPARALWFDLESGHTKCISDEIKVNSMAVGSKSGPTPNSPTPGSSHRISLRVTSPYKNSIHYTENMQSGHLAFTAMEAGDYLACFSAPDHKPPVSIGFWVRSGGISSSVLTSEKLKCLLMSLSLLVKPWIISDMLAATPVKFHAEAQSLMEELEKTNSELLSMEEVTNCLLTPKLAGA